MATKIIQTKRRGERVKKSIYISLEVGKYLDTLNDSISGYLERLVLEDIKKKKRYNK